MSSASEILQYEPPEECHLLQPIDNDLLEHDHSRTYDATGKKVVHYTCNMTMDDTPVVEALVESEHQLLAGDVIYESVALGSASHCVRLCAPLLNDVHVEFGEVSRQLPSVESKLTEPLENYLADDLAPFRAVTAGLAREISEDRQTGFAVTQIFCLGQLDLTTSIEHVEQPGYVDGQGIYSFSREQRVVFFSFFPGVEISWRPTINQIRVLREFPDKKGADRVFGAETVNDPYELTRAILSRFVLNRE